MAIFRKGMFRQSPCWRVEDFSLLEIKNFGPPASGGLLVVLEYKLKNTACIFEKFVVLSSSKEISWGWEMLVSEIGHVNSNSKSLYGVERNKVQAVKRTSGEKFGHFNESLSTNMISRNSNPFNNFICSVQSFFAPKVSESATKKYLSLIA